MKQKFLLFLLSIVLFSCLEELGSSDDDSSDAQTIYFTITNGSSYCDNDFSIAVYDSYSGSPIDYWIGSTLEAGETDFFERELNNDAVSIDLLLSPGDENCNHEHAAITVQDGDYVVWDMRNSYATLLGDDDPATDDPDNGGDNSGDDDDDDDGGSDGGSLYYPIGEITYKFYSGKTFSGRINFGTGEELVGGLDLMGTHNVGYSTNPVKSPKDMSYDNCWGSNYTIYEHLSNGKLEKYTGEWTASYDGQSTTVYIGY
ncbi:hypothetical protein N6H18_18580 [Reichenbachiella agarivorans]|uniref:Uncharacterized protein n=1 Tax=Reichenbachiella agarivorans TaxID=2979464 RepID=A0ABY6CP87_9BACT|nr:hypothetical protein [Reichenbachiella agarivorans]UXP32349.1 hypothetical protein N6H18_18580 [Reichenbachiella agarivorans]